MPLFRFIAMDNAGRKVQDVREADSEPALSKDLQRSGLFLMDAVLVKAPKVAQAPLRVRSESEVPLPDVGEFTEQLYLMVKSAMPVLPALASLAEQQKHAKFKKTLSAIQEQIKKGDTLSHAFGQYPGVFDPMYVNLLSVGEATAKLPEMLERISDYLEFQLDLRQKVRAAMVYPMVVLSASLAVILFLMLFVLPNFVEIFNQFNAPLPFATRMLLKASLFLRSYWYVFLAAAGGLIYGGEMWVRSPANRARLHLFALGLPILGPMIQAIILARILRTLATLIKSNVPILKALELTRAAANQAYYEDLLEKVTSWVSEGKGVASALYGAKYFPKTVANMIGTAEKTGSLPQVLEAAADHYEKDLEVSIQTAFAALEPIFVGFLSMVVALIAISIMQPIMSMGSIVGG